MEIVSRVCIAWWAQEGVGKNQDNELHNGVEFSQR